jgi:hypothetical protein
MAFLWSANCSLAQSDSTKTAVADTTAKAKPVETKQKDKSRKDEFIVYAGGNLSQLSVSSSTYESTGKLGYQLGVAYKRGKFFYWQVGARFSNSVYGLQIPNMPSDSSDGISVNSIDIPVTGGINFLAFVNRILALRLFVSADPTFNLGIGDNKLGLTKDNLNTFIFYGQAGLGVDVAFFILEAGYNYGFQDLFKESVKSKPGQLFVNLGFRF